MRADIREQLAGASVEELIGLILAHKEEERAGSALLLVGAEGGKRPLEIWNVLAEIPLDQADKISLYDHLVRAGTGAGQAELMARQIRQSFGPGSFRDRLITALFSQPSGTLSAALDAAGALEIEEERDAAWEGIVSRLGQAGQLDFGEIGLLMGRLRPEESANLAFGLGRWARSAGTQEERVTRMRGAVGFLAELNPEPAGAQKGDLVRALVEEASWHPFILWESLTAAQLDHHVTGDEESLGILASSMMSESPERTLEVASRLGPEAGPMFYHEACRLWAAMDVDKAVAWYHQNKGGLSAANSDAVASAMVRHALWRREIDAAREWLTQIQDEALRAQTAGDIKSREAGLNR